MKLLSNLVNVQYSGFIRAVFIVRKMGRCFRLTKHPKMTKVFARHSRKEDGESLEIESLDNIKYYNGRDLLDSTQDMTQ